MVILCGDPRKQSRHIGDIFIQVAHAVKASVLIELNCGRVVVKTKSKAYSMWRNKDRNTCDLYVGTKPQVEDAWAQMGNV